MSNIDDIIIWDRRSRYIIEHSGASIRSFHQRACIKLEFWVLVGVEMFHTWVL